MTNYQSANPRQRHQSIISLKSFARKDRAAIAIKCSIPFLEADKKHYQLIADKYWFTGDKRIQLVIIGVLLFWDSDSDFNVIYNTQI